MSVRILVRQNSTKVSKSYTNSQIITLHNFSKVIILSWLYWTNYIILRWVRDWKNDRKCKRTQTSRTTRYFQIGIQNFKAQKIWFLYQPSARCKKRFAPLWNLPKSSGSDYFYGPNFDFLQRPEAKFDTKILFLSVLGDVWESNRSHLVKTFPTNHFLQNLGVTNFTSQYTKNHLLSINN